VEAVTATEDARDVINKITATLPPSFVALLFINLLFILGLLWFIHDASIARIDAIKDIFRTCAANIGRIERAP
jgi:hypothetical protein